MKRKISTPDFIRIQELCREIAAITKKTLVIDSNDNPFHPMSQIIEEYSKEEYACMQERPYTTWLSDGRLIAELEKVLQTLGEAG